MRRNALESGEADGFSHRPNTLIFTRPQDVDTVNVTVACRLVPVGSTTSILIGLFLLSLAIFGWNYAKRYNKDLSIRKIVTSVYRRRREARVETTACLLIIAIWPFLFLWPYVFQLLTPGNDFMYLYYAYKAYLISFLGVGEFPAWSPMEGAGFPFFSNPFAQPLYPMNLIYLGYYLLFGHFSAYDYTLFTILAFSVFGAGLFLWLRRLSIPSMFALATVLIAVMSLKVMELLRFPNAAHAAAWMPWVLYGLTLAADRQKLRTGAVLVGVSTFMLLTAGYPYFVVYSAVLFGPYFLLMMARPAREAFGVRPQSATNPVWFALGAGSGFAIAAAAAAPWLRHVQDLMGQTVDRGTPNFDFATANLFKLTDTLGSWVFPPAASNEGWYYFGVTTTLLILFYVTSCIVRWDRIDKREIVFVVILSVWLAGISYFSWGRDSALFTWVWHHVPVVNQMRVWGRINIVLVPLIALFLARALINYSAFLGNLRQSGRTPWGIAFLCVLAGAVVALQGYLMHHDIVSSWTDYFKLGASPRWTDKYVGFPWRIVRNFDERFFLLMTLLGAGVLIAAILVARKQAASANRFLLPAVVGVSILDLFFISGFQYLHPFIKLPKEKIPIAKDMDKLLAVPRNINSCTAAPWDYTRSCVGIIASWDFARHAEVFQKFFTRDGVPLPDVPSDEIEAARRFYGTDKRGQRIFVSQDIRHSSPKDFLADVDATAETAHPKVEIEGYDGDVLRLEVRIDRPAWVSFIDNWDANWTAEINDKPVEINKLFGAYKAVPVSAGVSKIVFAYRPALWPSRSSGRQSRVGDGG